MFFGTWLELRLGQLRNDAKNGSATSYGLDVVDYIFRAHTLENVPWYCFTSSCIAVDRPGDTLKWFEGYTREDGSTFWHPCRARGGIVSSSLFPGVPLRLEGASTPVRQYSHFHRLCTDDAWHVPRLNGAGENHTVLIRSNGIAVACGDDGAGQCDIPALNGGLKYIQAAAGYYHTVLLRSNGTAIAWGLNDNGCCNIPALDGDATYTQVAAGNLHTVLLRSDGTVVACGVNDPGQCAGQVWARRQNVSSARWCVRRRRGTAVIC